MSALSLFPAFRLQAHPFHLDYTRLHVGRQYREALIQLMYQEEDRFAAAASHANSAPAVSPPRLRRDEAEPPPREAADARDADEYLVWRADQ